MLGKVLTSRKEIRTVFILLKLFLLLFRFTSIFNIIFELIRRLLTPRLNSIEFLNLRLECRYIRFKFPIAFIIRKFFPFYKIFLLIIISPTTFISHDQSNLTTFNFGKSIASSKSYLTISNKMLITLIINSKVSLPKHKPASENPINSRPLRSYGNKVILRAII